MVFVRAASLPVPAGVYLFGTQAPSSQGRTYPTPEAAKLSEIALWNNCSKIEAHEKEFTLPRIKEYDEAALLDQTMEAFWSQGYDGTSIDALVGRTGVNRASLYSVYPDKRALFIAGIRRYLDLVVEDNIRRLREAESPGEAVRQFFLKLVDAPIDRLRRGCLLTNSATELGVEDAEVAALIRGAFRRVERALCDRLIEAQKENRLAAGVHPKTLARLLITVLQGIRVMSRVGVDRETMRDAVMAALSGIAATRGAAPAARRRGQRKIRTPATRTRAARAG